MSNPISNIQYPVSHFTQQPTFPHMLTSLPYTLQRPYLYLSAPKESFGPTGRFIIMSKTLQQITFDFSSEEEKDIRITGHDIPPEQEETAENPEPAAEQDSVSTVVEALEKRRSPRGRLSLKEVHLNADLIQIPPDEVLFQKQYYSIGEVSKWFKVNQSLIRYWETEFDILEPRKNRKGDRFFRPIDVKNLVLIHDLLRRRKFTIEGAKEFLKKNKKADEKFTMIQSLEKIKSFLNELKASL